MSLPKTATIVEVGARDGLQNESINIPTETKVEFINRLSDSGLKVIESTSFVSAKWVPQMADHSDVLTSINKKFGIRYPALVPNVTGLDNAIQCGATDIAVFTAASETFSQKNTSCSIDESLERIHEIIQKAQQHNIAVRGYVSCVLGCPYEGEIKPEKVAEVAKRLYELDCFEISLGDTIGVGTPNKAKALIETAAKDIPLKQLAVHFHDTYGQALANIYAALELGINTIDASVTGLGGCPYAPGAGGNVATEDVLYLLNGLGIETGVDMQKLIQAGNVILDYLQRPTRSKAGFVA